MTKLCEAGEGGKGQDIDDLRANDRTVKHGEQAELSRLVCQHVDSSFADSDLGALQRFESSPVKNNI